MKKDKDEELDQLERRLADSTAQMETLQADCDQKLKVETAWFELLFMPPPFEEWWRGIKCYPCPSVRYQNLVC